MADISVGCHSFHSALVYDVVEAAAVDVIIDCCQQILQNQLNHLLKKSHAAIRETVADAHYLHEVMI